MVGVGCAVAAAVGIVASSSSSAQWPAPPCAESALARWVGSRAIRATSTGTLHMVALRLFLAVRNRNRSC
eukprot:2874454-Pyramimonas_sp.AAC.1